jgi:hypothetical protein
MVEICQKMLNPSTSIFLDFHIFNLKSDRGGKNCSGSTLVEPGNTEGESITVQLTSCLTGLESGA